MAKNYSEILTQDIFAPTSSKPSRRQYYDNAPIGIAGFYEEEKPKKAPVRTFKKPTTVNYAEKYPNLLGDILGDSDRYANELVYGENAGVNKIPEAKKESPTQVQSEFDWGDLLVGATPLLMGLISGDGPAGYEYASKGLMQRHKEKRADRLAQDKLDAQKELAAQKLRATASSDKGNYQVYVEESADGTPIYRTFDKNRGVWLDGDKTIRAGYKPSIYTNPLTGEKEMKGASGKLIQGEQDPRIGKRKYTLAEEQKRNKIAEGILNSPKYRNAESVMTNAARAISLLSANNPIADAGIKTIFPRMFGETGNLAYQEQERFAGSPAIQRKWESLKKKFDDGLLTNEDRADLLEVANIMYAYDKENLERIARTGLERGKRGYEGLDASDILEPELKAGRPKAKRVLKKARDKDPRKGKDRYATREVEDGIWYYEIQPDGTYRDKNPVFRKK